MTEPNEPAKDEPESIQRDAVELDRQMIELDATAQESDAPVDNEIVTPEQVVEVEAQLAKDRDAREREQQDKAEALQKERDRIRAEDEALQPSKTPPKNPEAEEDTSSKS